MAEAIGQVLSFAVGVALSPVPIVGVVLMLGTPRARANGPAFVVGWVVAILVVGGIVLAAAGGAGAHESGGPASWSSVLQLVLGVLLVGVALRRWRGRPRDGEEGATPAWMRTVDRFTAVRSAALAAALVAVNPKNLLLVVGAAAAIAQTGAGTGPEVAALAVFAVVASVGVAAPVVLYLALGERSRRTLDGLREWMTANNAAIMATICLVIAAKLIGDGISGLGG